MNSRNHFPERKVDTFAIAFFLQHPRGTSQSKTAVIGRTMNNATLKIEALTGRLCDVKLRASADTPGIKG